MNFRPSKAQGLSAIAVVATMLSLATPSSAGPVFSSASYTSAVSFGDALFGTTMTIAFDGTNYWSTSGGSSGGDRYAQYNSSGGLISTYSPGLDFRSVFSNSSGDVFARAYADNTIYMQSSPGVFAPSGVTLDGSAFDNSQDQSSVVLNGPETELIALNDNGVVRRWTLAGASLASTNLVGWTGSENNYPRNRGIAAAGNYWFTLNDGVLSAWDSSSGARLDQTTLTGLGSGFDTNFSLSYANGMIFAVTDAHDQWLGFNVGAFGGPEPSVPAPAALVLLGFGLLGLGAMRRNRTQI